jgi:hypothetical protein
MDSWLNILNINKIAKMCIFIEKTSNVRNEIHVKVEFEDLLSLYIIFIRSLRK